VTQGSKQVDVLIIGGGPAALGILVNAVKTNRLNELLQGDGVAIIDAGLNFGGGTLSHYGINSNTSGGGFLKCSYKKHKTVGEKAGPEPKSDTNSIPGKKTNKPLKKAEPGAAYQQ
jgi:pyruvate/2-oxoglutarate dehydrogenase complex dihydrolipoamide dehydrogenase (E3) component